MLRDGRQAVAVKRPEVCAALQRATRRQTRCAAHTQPKAVVVVWMAFAIFASACTDKPRASDILYYLFN